MSDGTLSVRDRCEDFTYRDAGWSSSASSSSSCVAASTESSAKGTGVFLPPPHGSRKTQAGAAPTPGMPSQSMRSGSPSSCSQLGSGRRDVSRTSTPKVQCKPCGSGSPCPSIPELLTPQYREARVKNLLVSPRTAPGSPVQSPAVVLRPRFSSSRTWQPPMSRPAALQRSSPAKGLSSSSSSSMGAQRSASMDTETQGARAPYYCTPPPPSTRATKSRSSSPPCLLTDPPAAQLVLDHPGWQRNWLVDEPSTQQRQQQQQQQQSSPSPPPLQQQQQSSQSPPPLQQQQQRQPPSVLPPPLPPTPQQHQQQQADSRVRLVRPTPVQQLQERFQSKQQQQQQQPRPRYQEQAPPPLQVHGEQQQYCHQQQEEHQPLQAYHEQQQQQYHHHQQQQQEEEEEWSPRQARHEQQHQQQYHHHHQQQQQEGGCWEEDGGWPQQEGSEHDGSSREGPSGTSDATYTYTPDASASPYAAAPGAVYGWDAAAASMDGGYVHSMPAAAAATSHPCAVTMVPGVGYASPHMVAPGYGYMQQVMVPSWGAASYMPSTGYGTPAMPSMGVSPGCVPVMMVPMMAPASMGYWGGCPVAMPPTAAMQAAGPGGAPMVVPAMQQQ